MDPQSMGSQGSNVSSGGKLRLLSDCVAGKTDFNLGCMHMSSRTCTLCWIPAEMVMTISMVLQQSINIHI